MMCERLCIQKKRQGNATNRSQVHVYVDLNNEKSFFVSIESSRPSCASK